LATLAIEDKTSDRDFQIRNSNSYIHTYTHTHIPIHTHTHIYIYICIMSGQKQSRLSLLSIAESLEPIHETEHNAQGIDNTQSGSTLRLSNADDIGEHIIQSSGGSNTPQLQLQTLSLETDSTTRRQEYDNSRRRSSSNSSGSRSNVSVSPRVSLLSPARRHARNTESESESDATQHPAYKYRSDKSDAENDTASRISSTSSTRRDNRRNSDWLSPLRKKLIKEVIVQTPSVSDCDCESLSGPDSESLSNATDDNESEAPSNTIQNAVPVKRARPPMLQRAATYEPASPTSVHERPHRHSSPEPHTGAQSQRRYSTSSTSDVGRIIPIDFSAGLRRRFSQRSSSVSEISVAPSAVSASVTEALLPDALVHNTPKPNATEHGQSWTYSIGHLLTHMIRFVFVWLLSLMTKPGASCSSFRDWFVSYRPLLQRGLISIAILYNVFTVPFRLAFTLNSSVQASSAAVTAREIETTWQWLDTVADICYMIDFLILFHEHARTKYQQLLQRAIDDGDSQSFFTARRRLDLDLALFNRGHFLLMLLSTIPLASSFPATVVWFCSESTVGQWRISWLSRTFFAMTSSLWWRLFRLLRFGQLRMYIVFWEASNLRTHILPQALLKLLKLASVMYLAAHFIGCAYYMLSAVEGFPYDNKFVVGQHILRGDQLSLQYMHVIYWSFSAMTGVGEGVGEPETFVEHVFTIGVLVAGVTIYATLLGNLSRILTHVQTNVQRYLERIEHVNSFCEKHQVPIDLRTRLRNCFEYMHYHNQLDNEWDALASVPRYLRNEVMVALYGPIVRNVRLFQNCEEGFIRSLVVQLRPQIVLPGDWLIRQGDVGREMYLVVRGKLNVIANGKVVATVSDGSYVGEVAILYEQKRIASVVAETYCDLLMLSKESMDLVVDLYPRVLEEMESEAKLYPSIQKMLKERHDAILKEHQAKNHDIERGSLASPRKPASSVVTNTNAPVSPLGTPRSARLSMHGAQNMHNTMGHGDSPAYSPMALSPTAASALNPMSPRELSPLHRRNSSRFDFASITEMLAPKPMISAAATQNSNAIAENPDDSSLSSCTAAQSCNDDGVPQEDENDTHDGAPADAVGDGRHSHTIEWLTDSDNKHSDRSYDSSSNDQSVHDASGSPVVDKDVSSSATSALQSKPTVFTHRRSLQRRRSIF
jgi:CRP-like cAMP-binding protein